MMFLLIVLVKGLLHIATYNLLMNMPLICQKLEPTIKYSTNCTNCKHAIPLSNNYYCTKLKKPINKTRNCPYFEPEPIEYKVYIRM